MDPVKDKLIKKVEKYGELDQAEKALTKEKDPLNKEIKTEMRALGLDSLDVNGYTASYSIQQRSSTDESKLLAYLELRGLEEAIVTVRKPDASMVEDLIHQGRLSVEEIAHCVNIKEVEVLSVKPAKASKAASTTKPKAAVSPKLPAGGGIVTEQTVIFGDTAPEVIIPTPPSKTFRTNLGDTF